MSISGPPAARASASSSNNAASVQPQARIDSCRNHVGEVRVTSLGGEDRSVELEADEGPGAARSKGEPAAGSGQGGNRRGGVVGGDGGHDGCRRQAEPGAQLLSDKATDLAGLLDRR